MRYYSVQKTSREDYKQALKKATFVDTFTVSLGSEMGNSGRPLI